MAVLGAMRVTIPHFFSQIASGAEKKNTVCCGIPAALGHPGYVTFGAQQYQCVHAGGPVAWGKCGDDHDGIGVSTASCQWKPNPKVKATCANRIPGHWVMNSCEQCARGMPANLLQ